MISPHINVTPLIDVLLVLLIIFMVVAPMKPSSFQAKVPSEPDSSVIISPNPHALVVSIDDRNELSVNKLSAIGTVDDPAYLTAYLRSIFEQRQKNFVFDDEGRTVRTVFIKAPRKIGYGNVVKVIDAVKMAGAEPIALQIDHLDQFDGVSYR